MAIYTKLSESKLREFFSKYNLGNFINYKEIKEGIENTNYFIETEKGKFILTLYEKRVDEKDLPFFMSLMKNLLSNYESKIDKSKKEVMVIINSAKKDSEKTILEKTEKFHQIMENKKKNAEQKIIQMKENALRDIKNISVKISMEAVELLIKNSVDKNKLEKLYTNSLEQAKTSLKHIKA